MPTSRKFSDGGVVAGCWIDVAHMNCPSTVEYDPPTGGTVKYEVWITALKEGFCGLSEPPYPARDSRFEPLVVRCVEDPSPASVASIPEVAEMLERATAVAEVELRPVAEPLKLRVDRTAKLVPAPERIRAWEVQVSVHESSWARSGNSGLTGTFPTESEARAAMERRRSTAPELRYRVVEVGK